MFNKKKKIFIALLFALSLSFLVGQAVLAQVDVGTNEINNTIALGNSSPIATATRIINIVMLILGILAVALVIYGGFVWMSSNGDEEKVSQAKRILRNGVIGLVIILSAWGITYFVLTRLLGNNSGGGGGGGSNPTCTSGQSLSCGCGGYMNCVSGSWGPCLNSDCNIGGGPESCDGSALAGCQATDQICSSDSYCDNSTCTCKPKGQIGDSCDGNSANASCQADNTLCGDYLTCDNTTCTCQGNPTITAISPVGSFCSDDVNKSCKSDADCNGSCNTSNPNGAVGNLITITGANFGTYEAGKSLVTFNGGNLAALTPDTLNSSCGVSWTNNQIIVAIPSGATNGPIEVIRADGKSDVTDDQNGPNIPDFVANNIIRPGLCQLSPDSGQLSQDLSYQGLNLYSGEAYFGSYNQNVKGLDSSFSDPQGLSGTASVPNINKGQVSSFVIADINGNKEPSNYVVFDKQAEAASGPYISYFEPTEGSAGQYVTIHGSGFGGARGSSQVYFGQTAADYSFPPVCASSIWGDQQIIVKVPKDLPDGNYQINIDIGGQQISSREANPNVFQVKASDSLNSNICKIYPEKGQIGTPVDIWGEYFGNQGGDVLAVFSNNKPVSAKVAEDQNADYINALVPDQAVTGPLKVVKNGQWGNDINFAVGTCNSDSECGTGVCCPTNTYKQGRCEDSLSSCYANIPNSVFEWSFVSGYGDVGDNGNVDCSKFTSQEACAAHSDSCCFDSMGTATTADDVCRGGSGTDLTNDPNNPDYGYCAYYDCQSASSTPPGDPSLCADNSPLKIGYFKDKNTCTDTCHTNPGASYCAQFDSNQDACSNATGCCFNLSDQKCLGGEKLDSGYCAYYNCQAPPNQYQCDSQASTTGAYLGLNNCNEACSQTPLGGLGQDCFGKTTTDGSCNFSLCSSPFACLAADGSTGISGSCGTCCCQPGDSNSCAGIGNGNLVCQPDQGSCSGASRGLCCGCSADTDCGNVDTMGCDATACCNNRPNVVDNETQPTPNSEGVCRNAAISVSFDQAMDLNSLNKDNIMLLEEKSLGDTCPTGTYLTYNSFLGGQHYSASNPDNIYCFVPGDISFSQQAGKTSFSMSPKTLLDPHSKYYVVVKGDVSLDSNSGVLSASELGMNGRGYLDPNTGQYIEGKNVYFNSLYFANSYIFSFTTLSDQGGNSGVCAVDYTKIAPNSYLFQTANNDPKEDDSDFNSSSFDTVKDADKVFSVAAYSADGQLLHPSTGYFWNWGWFINKDKVAYIKNVFNIPKDKVLVSAREGISDDSAELTSSLNMDAFSAPNCDASPDCSCVGETCINNCCNIYNTGQNLSSKANLFVFLCNNPWPAVDPNTGTWSPWYDTCSGVSGDCSNYNYKFYYCRDAGQPGIADDLPAMINPAVIKGNSSLLTCSEGQEPCSTLGASCGPDKNQDGVGDGLCIWNVLKESYFFKAAKPTVGEISAAVDQANGSQVLLKWSGNSSLIYSSNPAQTGKYRIYYTPASSKKLSFVDLKPSDPYKDNTNISACTPAAPAPSQDYNCQFMISGLTAGETYKFQVSAISANQVESALSGEKEVTVSDHIPPAVPKNFYVSVIDNKTAHFTWTPNTDDALFYRIYYGTDPTHYGESFDSADHASSLDVPLTYFQRYNNSFAITAIDASGNESAKSQPLNVGFEGL